MVARHEKGGGMTLLRFPSTRTERVNGNGVKEIKHTSGRWVPECCSTCHNLDAEWGEFGEFLAGPYCLKNLFLPTKRGTCKLKDA